MLVELYPRVHRRYSSLPVLGSKLDSYVEWMLQQGYPRQRLRQHCRTARKLERVFLQRGIQRPSDLSRERLRACAPPDSQGDPDLTALVRSLERYLDANGALRAASAPTRVQIEVARYVGYLEEVRGLAPSTIAQHVAAAAEFLAHLSYESRPERLRGLMASDLESFLMVVGKRVARASLQHVVSRLRAFLRFLASRGEIPSGLDTQIDTPRVYRGEQLSRALPWDTVRAFLRSIHRTSRLGLRDYAIFLLIATYGLRCSEVVTLTLDDIEWRAGRIRIPQRKTGRPFLLPLTDEVAASLMEYLRGGRPPLKCREVFLRGRAPAGVLKPAAVTDAFQKWTRRSGLRIPFQGAHCLRHSYAVHLLRQGTPLKTIGDLLGHRSMDSTCVYLRLAVEDLRDVALSLPHGPLPQEDQGVDRD